MPNTPIHEMNLYLLDAETDSLTVGWDPIPNMIAYELSMSANDATSFDVLSSSLTITVAKKKKLQNGVSYKFRVRALSTDKIWGEFSPVSSPFSPLTPDAKQMEQPILIKSDYCSITIQWEAVPDAAGYELQYRSVPNQGEHGMDWVTVPSLITNIFARKKNLLYEVYYYFRVKPIFNLTDSNAELLKWVFGKSSNALNVAQLAPNLKSFLPTQLIHGKPTVDNLVQTTTALSGKIIGLYFSAHWCGPCRNFTPQLIGIYEECKRKQIDFEVIFISADHNEKEFLSYYESMRHIWCTIAYDDSSRENIQGMFQVNGIPRLVILNSKSGKVIDNNVLQSGGINIQKVQDWIKLL